MLFGSSGFSWQDGPRTKLLEEDSILSGNAALQNRVCAEGVLAPGIDPRAAEDASRGPALALLSLMPAMASMS